MQSSPERRKDTRVLGWVPGLCLYRIGWGKLRLRAKFTIFWYTWFRYCWKVGNLRISESRLRWVYLLQENPQVRKFTIFSSLNFFSLSNHPKFSWVSNVSFFWLSESSKIFLVRAMFRFLRVCYVFCKARNSRYKKVQEICTS